MTNPGGSTPPTITKKMNDWYNDPPENPEPPECCGDIMDVTDLGACHCTTCGKRIEPEIDPELYDMGLPDNETETYY